MAPLGFAIQIYENPERRASWATNSIRGWNLGTPTKIYYWYNVWSREKGVKILSDTVYFKHRYIKNPTVTPEYAVVQEAQQLTASLKVNLTRSMDEN